VTIKENYSTDLAVCKFSRGLYDPLKDISLSSGAIHECFEETGIRAQIDSLLLSRFNTQAHIYDTPDLYFVFKLIPEV
jgi:8-oxo-dGTP pyrophosphatase MutT (NUDIX family)